MKGLTGDVKIETGWNNIRSRSFTIKQARVLQGLQAIEENPDTVSSVALTEADCRAAAVRQGLIAGGVGWAFAGNWVRHKR